MSKLLEAQPLFERLGVLSQDKKSRIVFILFFRYIRMMKTVIKIMIGKMPVDKMSIGFQSRGMVTSLMLMNVCTFTVAMFCFRMVVYEREYKEWNDDPQKDQLPKTQIIPVQLKGHQRKP